MALDLTVYGFPRSYSCRELSLVPRGVEAILVPSESSPEEGPRLFVEITPAGGLTWVGAFRRGFDDYLEALLETADPNSLCVVAGGTAYAVPVRDPNLSRELKVVPTVSAMGSQGAGLLFIASFNVVAAFDSAMQEIWRVNLDSDGIEFVEAGARNLIVRAYMPGLDDWVVRTISLSDGASPKPEDAVH